MIKVEVEKNLFWRSLNQIKSGKVDINYTWE